MGSEVQVLPGPFIPWLCDGLAVVALSPLAMFPRPRGYGGIAQLVEHLLCKQGVIGSNPFASRPSAAGSLVAAGCPWNGLGMPVRKHRARDRAMG